MHRAFSSLFSAACVALVPLIVLPTSVFAQAEVGTCEHGSAFLDLSVNEVDARMFNTGNLFYAIGDEGRYVVPKDSGTIALWATGLWLGGRVGGQLRTAVTRYGYSDYWPGPLDDGGLPTNPEDCRAYDELFRVSRDDLRMLKETSQVPESVARWPFDLGAPVLHGDGNPDVYDVENGDRPALLGDEMIWWVMNDAGNVHEHTESEPLNMEVQVSAFAFESVDGTSDLDGILPYTTFYRYELIYHGQTTLEDAYIGLYVDPDLGAANDDYVATDTTRNLIYVYNARKQDADYGVPPALGFAVLNGPVDEAGAPLLTASLYYVGGGPSGIEDPIESEGFYNNLRGLFSSGAPITEGGWGIHTEGRQTTYMYPGDPVGGYFWSEVNTDGEGAQHQHGDRRMMLSSGPFDMQPGESATLEFAIVFAQGENRFDSIEELRRSVDLVSMNRAELFTPDSSTVLSAGQVHHPSTFLQTRIYPRPAAETVTLELDLEGPAEIVIRIYDSLGRVVKYVDMGMVSAGRTTRLLDTSDLASGVYVMKVSSAFGGSHHQNGSVSTMVVQ